MVPSFGLHHYFRDPSIRPVTQKADGMWPKESHAEFIHRGFSVVPRPLTLGTQCCQTVGMPSRKKNQNSFYEALRPHKRVLCAFWAAPVLVRPEVRLELDVWPKAAQKA